MPDKSGIEWENLAEAEVSEADKNHPLLKDVKPIEKNFYENDFF